MRTALLVLVMLSASLARFPSFNPNGPNPAHRPFTKHPLARSKFYGSLTGPLPTNQWWQSFVLGKGTSNVNALPILVQAHPDGFRISTSDTNRDIVADNYVATIHGNDWAIGANEGLGTQSVVAYKELSVTYQYASSSSKMTIPLVQGVPFLTAELEGLTPKLQTASAIVKVSTSQGTYAPGQTTGASQIFTITLNTTQVWVVYSSKSVTLNVAKQTLNFNQQFSTGYIRIGFVGKSDKTSLVANNLDVYPTSGTIDYSFNNGKYQLYYKYTTNKQGAFLLSLLPHHQQIVQGVSYLNMNIDSIKGTMKTILVSNNQIMLQDQLVSILWDAPTPVDSSKKSQIVDALKQDALGPYPDPNTNDPYWFGLKIARFARLVLIADQVGETQIANDVAKKVESLITLWLTGQNKDQLRYDQTYGGLCSVWGLQDPQADFGQGYYNDHYFHYGYHIYTIAVLVKRNPSFYTQYSQSILDLVQDIANPDLNDKFYVESRHKDWFAGHSWANGLFDFFDNRNQESTSEALNAYYSIYLLGQAIGNTNMKNWGNLLMSTEMQSTKNYWQMPSSNQNYPEKFKKNKIVGMVWSTKSDHATWFGGQKIFIHGVNMLPFTPVTELLLSPSFIAEEYPLIQNQKDNLDWQCYEMMDQSIINKEAAWSRAVQLDRQHDGSSKTNMLYWIATRPVPRGTVQELLHQMINKVIGEQE